MEHTALKPSGIEQSFYGLHPDDIMEALEQYKFVPTGRYTQLNSYENRVYEIELEEPSHGLSINKLVTKFYRPNRWSMNALKEEHDFLTELNDSGVTVVAPIALELGKTIGSKDDIFFCVFPKFMGRMPQELQPAEYKSIGRTLARLHNVGEQKRSSHRPTLSTENMGWSSLEILQNWVAPDVWNDYCESAEDILYFLEEHLRPEKFIRIHGDCHKGNLLYDDSFSAQKDFFFVDFDDFVTGPAVQDFWMLLPEETLGVEFNNLISGYEELREVNDRDFQLIPALRALRIIHYSAWIARRWKDPHFPALFPQFTDYNYWAMEMEKLRQISWSLES